MKLLLAKEEMAQQGIIDKLTEDGRRSRIEKNATKKLK
jgi:hypothetical protein